MSLKPFGKYFDITKPCCLIIESTFVGYRKYLIEKYSSDYTINNKLRGSRAFLNFCMKNKYIVPSFDMELIEAKKKIKEAYTDYELNLLFKKPPKNCDFSEYRNWVIVQYLLGTGQRLNTIINIKNKDIDLENHCILLTTTKNKKQRLFPISKFLMPILREYMKRRKGAPDDFLFCNIYGEKFTRNGIEIAISRYNKSRGVTKTSCHLFRHTFARKLVYNGAQALELKELLGHDTMDMSLEYLDEFNIDFTKNIDMFDPLKQFNNGKKAIKNK